MKTPIPSQSIVHRLPSLLARQWLVLLALVLYLPMVFLGYGSDVDTFRVLNSGRSFLATADYVPSRRPGFLIHELTTFVLDQLGGSFMANLGTLFWALVALTCFIRICRRHRIPNSRLLALILIVHPIFWYNATASIDYLWAIGMLLAGFDLLEQEHFGWAGLALGLSVGCRISSLPVAGLLLAYAALQYPGKRWQVARAGLLFALLAVLAYLLPWDFSEWRSSFWQVSVGPKALWSPVMLLGRFTYKNLYFWGLPAALFLLFVLFHAVRNVSAWKEPGAARLGSLCILVLLSLQALFFRYPIEVEYLLSTLPFWLLLVGLSLPRKRLLAVLFVLVFSYNLVNVNLARPDLPGQASSFTLGFWIEPGYLLQETAIRLSLAGCDSHACYNDRIARRPDLELESGE